MSAKAKHLFIDYYLNGKLRLIYRFVNLSQIEFFNVSKKYRLFFSVHELTFLHLKE